MIQRPLSLPEISSLLQSLLRRKAIEPGKQLHAHLIVSGLSSHPFLTANLLHLYSLRHHFSHAHHLLDRIPRPSVFLFNVLIKAHAEPPPSSKALELFHGMLHRGLRPDNYTFPFVLKALAALHSLSAVKLVHAMAARSAFRGHVFLRAALVDAYAKCGSVALAEAVFEEIAAGRDAVLWNAMIAAYAHSALPLRALSLCRAMAESGFRATEATLVTAISAATDSSALSKGREIQALSYRLGFGGNSKVETALVDFYAKGGKLASARVLFDELSNKRVVSWNAIISGYAIHGRAEEAIELFERMKGEGQRPDEITFLGVLSACRHGRLLELAFELLRSMKRDYGIEPAVQHFTCLVDLLGHCGKLGRAYKLIETMPMEADAGVWGSLLNACKIHRDVELGEVAMAKLAEIEPDDAGNYVILSNLYSVAGDWEGVARMRTTIRERGLKKAVARSWIEVKNQVHGFLAGDRLHPMKEEIYAELDVLHGLVKKTGYVADTRHALHDVDEDEKAEMVRSHSERLAIAFGIISTLPGTTLVVTKNLRVCEDCHEFIKRVSRIVKREIIVRDVNRYHTFKEGACSCGDRW